MQLSKNIQNSVFIILILTGSLLIRSYNISNESLYGDEPYSIFQAQKSLSELKDVFLHDQNPPLHITLLHFWLNIFGISDITAKMFSIICSVLAGIILFTFSKKFLNTQTAVLSLVLFIFSNSQQFYATEVRPYALIQLLCISSFYFYFNILSETRKKDLIGLVLINTLLLYAHYLTIFIFIVQGISILFFLKSNKKGFIYYLISQIAVALLFLPWISVLLNNIPKEGSFWSHAPNFDDFLYHMNILLGNSLLFYSYISIILTTLIIVIIDRKNKIFNSSFNKKYFAIFLLLSLLPILLDFFIAQFTPVFLTRYILYSTFGLFLLIAYSISTLNTHKYVQLLISTVLVVTVFSSFKFEQEREDEWKKIVPAIREKQNNNGIILISASYKFKDFAFYYDLNAFKDYKNSMKLLADKRVFYSPNDAIYGWEKLDYNSIEQIIYVHSHSQFEDPENKIEIFIYEKGFKKCSYYNRINTGYTVFIKKEKECNPLQILSEIKTEECDLIDQFWGKTLTGDSCLVCTTSFNEKQNCNNPFIIKQDSIDCMILNDKNTYGPGLFKGINELGNKRHIIVNGMVYNKMDSKGGIVISVEKDDKTFFRYDLNFNEELKTKNQWNEASIEIDLPIDLPEDASLKIYLWNPANEEVLINDFKFILQEK